MVPFVLVQPERVRHGSEYRVGDAVVAALLQPFVVVDAHTRQMRQLLPAQTGHPALS